MRSIIFALIFSFSTAALAQGGSIELAPDAPDHHVVVPGDTLWGISSKFLKDPFRWPDIWRMNAEQVKNPHRIYPGQVVILDRSGAEPQLRLGKLVKLEPQVRVTLEPKEIPAIPPQAIEPFLSQPLVIENGGFENAARVVATQESRVLSGNGNLIYADRIDPNIRHWQLFRPGKPFVDPDNGQVLGLEAIYLGNAGVIGDPGEVTTLQLTSIKQEIGRDDRLLPASRPEIVSYMPHLPAQQVDGSILSLYGGVGEGGRHSIVAVSRGSLDGIERGHVLAIYRAGAVVSNRLEDEKVRTHVLPDERYGLMFVFRVFDRVSYALVTDASRPVVPGDRVRNP